MCAAGASLCLLWINVYSCLLPFFSQIVCLFDIELYDLLIYLRY